MQKFKDLTGQHFGKLLVISRAENDKFGNAMWLCQCSCGNEKVIRTRSLLSGATQSCGCLYYGRKNHLIHGLSRTAIYRTLRNMKNRCYDKNHKTFPYYGGRGIKICQEWLNSCESFYEWAMANGYEGGLTIDRIDPDGDYCPENCRWVTMKEQYKNKRNNKPKEG